MDKMKKYVVVDIDGTISKVGDRLKYLKIDPPDWDKFYDDCFEDEPIKEIIHLVNKLGSIFHIIFCTGRRESVREKTFGWLRHNCLYIPNSEKYLLMRPNGDKRHDTEVKPELLENAGIELNEIQMVLEDRNSMVKKWRELGLICLQVADGNF